MKKIFTFLAVCSAVFTLAASETAAVKAVVYEFNKALLNLDGSGAEKKLHPQYVFISRFNRRTSLAQFRKKLSSLDRMGKLLPRAVAPGSKLSEIMAAAAAMVDEEFDLAELADMDSGADSKSTADMMRPDVQKNYQKLLKDLAAAMASYKVLDCSVNGNAAKLTYQMLMPTGETATVQADLVKVGGRWLIKTLTEKKVSK